MKASSFPSLFSASGRSAATASSTPLTPSSPLSPSTQQKPKSPGRSRFSKALPAPPSAWESSQPPLPSPTATFRPPVPPPDTMAAAPPPNPPAGRSGLPGLPGRAIRRRPVASPAAASASTSTPPPKLPEPRNLPELPRLPELPSLQLQSLSLSESFEAEISPRAPAQTWTAPAPAPARSQPVQSEASQATTSPAYTYDTYTYTPQTKRAPSPQPPSPGGASISSILSAYSEEVIPGDVSSASEATVSTIYSSYMTASPPPKWSTPSLGVHRTKSQKEEDELMTPLSYLLEGAYGDGEDEEGENGGGGENGEIAAESIPTQHQPQEPLQQQQQNLALPPRLASLRPLATANSTAVSVAENSPTTPRNTSPGIITGTTNNTTNARALNNAQPQQLWERRAGGKTELTVTTTTPPLPSKDELPRLPQQQQQHEPLPSLSLSLSLPLPSSPSARRLAQGPPLPPPQSPLPAPPSRDVLDQLQPPRSAAPSPASSPAPSARSLGGGGIGAGLPGRDIRPSRQTSAAVTPIPSPGPLARVATHSDQAKEATPAATANMGESLSKLESKVTSKVASKLTKPRGAELPLPLPPPPAPAKDGNEASVAAKPLPLQKDKAELLPLPRKALAGRDIRPVKPVKTEPLPPPPQSRDDDDERNMMSEAASESASEVASQLTIRATDQSMGGGSSSMSSAKSVSSDSADLLSTTTSSSLASSMTPATTPDTLEPEIALLGGLAPGMPPLFPTNYLAPAAPGTVYVAPPPSTVQFQCLQKHRDMFCDRNTHYPLSCQACQTAERTVRWRCKWCYLRICTECREALRVHAGQDLGRLMAWLEAGAAAAGPAGKDTTGGDVAGRDTTLGIAGLDDYYQSAIPGR